MEVMMVFIPSSQRIGCLGINLLLIYQNMAKSRYLCSEFTQRYT